MMPNVTAVVVTYNRRAMLAECIDALRHQSFSPQRIVIVNNASTDGTRELITQLTALNSAIDGLNLATNLGGAGGFYEGLKRAAIHEPDWFWLMDDDTIPRTDALEHLVTASAHTDNLALLCSQVVWTDATPHWMNIPEISSRLRCNGKVLAFNDEADKGRLRITAASFVSVLISRRAVQVCGLPLKSMFIYGDDYEYTSRICSRFGGFFVPRSVVVHRTKTNRGTDLAAADLTELWKYFYEYRNQTYLARRRGVAAVARRLIESLATEIPKIWKRRDGKQKALGMYLRGTITGLSFRPRIEYLDPD